MRRFSGLLPGLSALVYEVGRRAQEVHSVWTPPVAAAARWAWRASCAYVSSLVTSYAKAAGELVRNPLLCSGTMYVCMPGEAAVLQHVMSDVSSVCVRVCVLTAQKLVNFTINNSINVIIFFLMIIAIELVYWLLRYIVDYGRNRADGEREINSAPVTCRLALRFHMHRHRSGRQFRHRRIVNRLERPLRVRDQYAEFTRCQLRLFAALVVVLLVGYALAAVAFASKASQFLATERSATDPGPTCWHTLGVWDETGFFVCGNTDDPRTDFERNFWEQGGALSVGTLIPSLDELRALPRVLAEVVEHATDPYDRSAWAIPTAWDYPGTLVPMIIAPSFPVPQIVPPFQSDAQSFIGICVNLTN
jgi:hypothetical protein